MPIIALLLIGPTVMTHQNANTGGRKNKEENRNENKKTD